MAEFSLPGTILFIDPLPKSITSAIISINSSISFDKNSKSQVHGIINYPLEKFNLLTIQHNNNEYSIFGNYGYLFSDIKYAKLSFNFETEVYCIEELKDLAGVEFRFKEQILQMVDYKHDLQGNKLYEWSILTHSLNIVPINTLKESIATNSSDCKAIYVDTHMVSEQDMEIIQKNSGSKGIGKSDMSLNLTTINFKSKEAIREGHEMEDFLDSTNYLKSIIQQHNDAKKRGINIMQELQLSFILGFSLANYSCFMQWHRLLELLFKCSDKVELIECLQLFNTGDENNLNYKRNYLLEFYELIFQQWNLLDWEYKQHFINIEKWKYFLEKIEYSITNMEVDEDTVDSMVFKVKEQLLALEQESDQDPFGDENNMASVSEIECESDIQSDGNVNLYETESSDNLYVEIYGSSEDEFAPATVASITYKRRSMLD